MEFSITFIQLFFWGVYLAAPILLMLCTLIIIVGQIVGRLEGWDRFNALYWSFITALTVGYGDISPKTVLGQSIASLIMILGYAIIAVPTGIVTSEMTWARKKEVSTQVCPNCCVEGHDYGAKYCRDCGHKL